MSKAGKTAGADAPSANPIRPIYRRFRMKSSELTAMYLPGKGTLRDVCHALASAADDKAFAALMALDETILYRTAERRQKQRDRLAAECPAFVASRARFAEAREALFERYAEKGPDGAVLTETDEHGDSRVMVAEANREAFCREEQAACDAHAADVAEILTPGSGRFPRQLEEFDRQVVAVNLCVFRWADVPASVGGGMLLAGLPLFDGVPAEVVKEAERFRKQEESRPVGIADRLLAWQGIRPATDGVPGELVEGPAAVPVQASVQDAGAETTEP